MPLMDSTWLLAAALLLPVTTAALAGIESRWSTARWLGKLELLLVAACWTLSLVAPMDTAWLRLQPVNMTVLLLISFIALVVTHYAGTSLDGESGDDRFLRWLALTRLAVMVVVASNDLLLFWLAWAGISLSLHQLLLFYPDRPRAILAAHKKFILARIGEVMLAVAFWLLYDAAGSLQISSLLATLAETPLNLQTEAAAILLAGVAIIRCAQMPLHGWLIQVVEAPTPVSALLHAGIVNLGGFLLLQFAPVFDASNAARWFVLLIAGPSTVLAALVMSTRISIKVRLAWSTTAQMGLMLVECALGLYELALLHLVAHACYKAHAFLASGNAVNDYLESALSPARDAKQRHWLLAGVTAAVIVATLVAALDMAPPLSPWLLMLFTSIVLIATWADRGERFRLLPGMVTVSLMLLAYCIAKWSSAALLVPTGNIEGHYSALQDAFTCVLFTGLFVTWLALHLWPKHPAMRRLFIALNAGFYLDEWTTRTTLQLWPVRVPRTSRKSLISSQESAS